MQAGAIEKELELQCLNGQLEQSTEDLNQYRENDPETYKAMGGMGAFWRTLLSSAHV